MGDVADSAIVFWDGRSKGSKLMIDIMHELKKPVVAISYDGKVLSQVIKEGMTPFLKPFNP